MSNKRTTLILGAGFSGQKYGALLSSDGMQVFGTTRSQDKVPELKKAGIQPIVFDGSKLTPALQDAINQATDVVVSIAPNEFGDPSLKALSSALSSAPHLSWIGYLSTVGVYGHHDGAWVDEESTCKPVSKRSVQRMEAELEWRTFATTQELPLAILRLSGIYGPGRNALKNMAEGKARRLVKAGQVFNRIHVADIAGSLRFLSNMRANGIYNVTDDMPSPPQDVVEYAASVTKIDPPEPIDFETATLSPMARSFYGENKRVSNAKLKEAGFQFQYSDYRQSLKKMWDEDDWR
ncbi:SDR family NAD(P)-dependent oxidoreductase [Ahrensia kielensis]|uniref:SDR family NAD(P)-dependent oxidoreductase n=1 Tax=Ahrensia kielensis TaxID=76980 RepID=A0ABU9T6X0_9HYPH